MKKIFTFLSTLLFATAVFAQAPTLPIDFESTTIMYTFADFAGGVASVVDNPDKTGINTSAKVGQMVKFAGEVYGGSTLALAGPIDFGTNNAAKMKVWANRVDAPVLFKLEGTTPVEITAKTTVANQWEELTFSLAGFTGLEFTAITIIYDLGVVGDGSANFTMYFDDMELTTATAGGVQLPVDFESTTLTYPFADFAGGVATIIDNPDKTGINTSAKVGQMVKFAGEVYGGSTLSLGGPIDFGTNTSINMKVWANRVGAPVLFKLEGPVPAEVTANTTVANAWEELTFDFTGLTAAVYTGITIIYDLGVVGDGGANFTLFFDDIKFPGSVGTVDLKELGIDFYPNPVNDFMIITAQDDIEMISVYNLAGQQVYFARPAANQSTVDLTALSAGAYFVRIGVDGKEGTAKIIKQ